jgi:hypothetical protein
MGLLAENDRLFVDNENVDGGGPEDPPPPPPPHDDKKQIAASDDKPVDQDLIDPRLDGISPPLRVRQSVTVTSPSAFGRALLLWCRTAMRR